MDELVAVVLAIGIGLASPVDPALSPSSGTEVLPDILVALFVT